MPLTSIAQGALFAERIGSGSPTVLALHGWGRRGADFAGALAGLDALALDLPGFGASPPPDQPMGAAGYARLIAPAFELFDRPPVVVGHSFGGRVAVARQANAPSASGLVLIASPLVRRDTLGRRPASTFRLLRWAHRRGMVNDAAMEKVRRRRGSADYRAATGVMRDVLVTAVNESYQAELGRLGIPAHLLWGSDDAEVPVEVAETARQLIDEAGDPVELEVIEGAGHHLPVQHPEVVGRAVRGMLERVMP